MTLAQWYRDQIIRGPLVIGKNMLNMLTWCNIKFDGDPFNLDTYRIM